MGLFLKNRIWLDRVKKKKKNSQETTTQKNVDMKIEWTRFPNLYV